MNPRLYYRNGGKQYNTAILSGVCSPPNNFVVQKYSNNIQSGVSDGIALVNTIDEVIEFISNEGSLEGLAGPATNKKYVGIEASESNLNSNAGISLQLVGEGCNRNDFTWLLTSAKSSAGEVNHNQTIKYVVPSVEYWKYQHIYTYIY